MSSRLRSSRYACLSSRTHAHSLLTQEIGVTHVRILEGVATFVQLTGLLARLCRLCEAKPLIVQTRPWLVTPEGD